MNELLTSTLAEIVKTNHRTASVFEKYQLDFCCKGKRTLQQACDESKLPSGEVLAELEEVLAEETRGEIDFQQMSLQGLVGYIVDTHHSFVKRELPSISGFLEKLAGKHGGRHAELIRIAQLFNAVKEEMELHMKKEELILFPRIIEMEKLLEKAKEIQLKHTYIQAPIKIMEQEHEYAGNLLAEIRELSNDYTPPADACTTYRICYAALKAFEADLHKHVHLENNILFPKSMQLFGIPSEYSLN